MAEFAQQVQKHLTEFGGTTPRALESLFPDLFDDIRGLAAIILRGQRAWHTLQPTDLVNEAYVKLVKQHGAEFADGPHLKAVAAIAMRQILVDHARSKSAKKRGDGAARLTFDEALFGDDDAKNSPTLLDLEEKLGELSLLDERRARVAELKLFGELTFAEIAEVLDWAPKTVEADWYLARAWLRVQLGQ